jgi:phosphatidylglycerophosphate synthase
MDSESIDFRNPAILITLGRIVSAISTFTLLVSGILYTLIFFMKILEALSDFADGFVARKYGYVSNWGRRLDPAADKFSNGSSEIFIIMGCMGYLGYLEKTFPQINVTFVWLLLFMQIVLLLSGGYLERRGYEIKPNKAGKSKTVCECIFINLYMVVFLQPFGFCWQNARIIQLANVFLILTVGLAMGSIVLHMLDCFWPAKKVSCA